MATTIQQAAANALASYLAGVLTDVKVSQRWPDPGRRLPAKAITVLLAGRRRDNPIGTSILASTPSTGNNSTSVWRFMMCEQDIQLDVWATTDVARDDIIARLDDALNAGFPLNAGPVDPVGFGLGLPLADGWSDFPGVTTYADYMFNGPDIDDDPNSVTESEFRATYLGTMHMCLTSTKTTPRQVQIILQLATSESTDTSPDTITIP
jgi:hypothetical protein